MKTLVSRLLCAGALLCAAGAGAAEPGKDALPKDLPPFGQDRPLPVPQIVQRKLPEGLTLWLVPRPGFPKVTAVLAVRGGGAADPKGAEGLSDLLADVLKEGTKARSAQRIAEELQAVGGEIGAASSADAIYLHGSALPHGAARLIDVMADVARDAAFPDGEVALAKTNAVQGLLAQEATPEFLARKVFAREVFGDHPYRTVAPTRESLAAMSADGLRKEHARRFRPERALLVVAGDFTAEALAAQVTQRFAGWKGGGEAPAPTPAAPAAGGRRILVVHRPGSVQSLIQLGRTAAAVTEPDYYPLLVASTICCGSFSSRLVKNIREDKGYTYSPRGGVTPQEKGSVLRLRADVRSEVTGASLMEMFYEADRMAVTLPTAEELERAKRYQNGIYLLQNQMQGAVAQTLAAYWVNGLPPEALGEFVKKVNAVTAPQVRDVSRRHFSSMTQTVVVVGDRDKVKAELQPFGKVEETRP